MTPENASPSPADTTREAWSTPTLTDLGTVGEMTAVGIGIGGDALNLAS